MGVDAPSIVAFHVDVQKGLNRGSSTRDSSRGGWKEVGRNAAARTGYDIRYGTVDVCRGGRISRGRERTKFSLWLVRLGLVLSMRCSIEHEYTVVHHIV